MNLDDSQYMGIKANPLFVRLQLQPFSVFLRYPKAYIGCLLLIFGHL